MYVYIYFFIPCIEKYSQSEARITVAYSAVCNGWYATGSIPLFFRVITCAQQFTGVHLRTSQKPAPKLFNSCEPLRTFPIASGNFPKISEHFRRFPKIFRKFWKIIKTSENYFWTVSEVFRQFPKISVDFQKFWKIIKHLENTFELFPKFSKSFKNCLSSSNTGLNRFRSFRKFAEICKLFPKFPQVFRRFWHGIK